jgi:hypothetical protein
LTFLNGNSDMDTYIDLMATQLVAGGNFSEPDAVFYPAGAHPAKRVLQSTQDANFFFFLQRIVLNGNSTNAVNGLGPVRFNEIRVSFGTGYSVGTHLLTGTTQDCGIPAEAWCNDGSGNFGNVAAGNVGSGNKTLQHFTWVDAQGICGALYFTSAANICDFTVFYCLERLATKEYADGFSNFFFASLPNEDRQITTSQGQTISRYYGPFTFTDPETNVNQGDQGSVLRPLYFHPFNALPVNDIVPIDVGTTPVTAGYPYPRYGSPGNAAVLALNAFDIGRIGGIEEFFPAIRSPGNSKAYFAFPYYSANKDPLQPSLVALTAKWFRIHPSAGLNDGDLLNYVAPGPVTQTYIVKQLNSPDTAGARMVALRFA